jgi:hypothetical protein
VLGFPRAASGFPNAAEAWHTGSLLGAESSG